MPTKNDSICPLCEQENRCDVNNNSDCWCINTKVLQALLDKTPVHLRGISCVCNKCIERFLQQQVLESSATKVIYILLGG